MPSRYALLTGRFAARMRRGNGPLIAEGQATIASLLRDNGYRTAMVGKWHQGFDQNVRRKGEQVKVIAFDYDQPLTGGPVDRGFDSFFGMHASLDIPPYFYIKDRAPSDGSDGSGRRQQQRRWRGRLEQNPRRVLARRRHRARL